MELPPGPAPVPVRTVLVFIIAGTMDCHPTLFLLLLLLKLPKQNKTYRSLFGDGADIAEIYFLG